MSLGCHGCGLAYGSSAWADVVIPDSLWQRISPRGDGGGVLCFNCMSRRLAELGLRNVPFLVTSGPFAFTPRDESGKTREAGATTCRPATIADSAVSVLQAEGKPMSATAIARRAMDWGWAVESVEQGRSRVAAIIAKDIKGPSPRFAKVGRGQIGLAEWPKEQQP